MDAFHNPAETKYGYSDKVLVTPGKRIPAVFALVFVHYTLSA